MHLRCRLAEPPRLSDTALRAYSLGLHAKLALYFLVTHIYCFIEMPLTIVSSNRSDALVLAAASRREPCESSLEDPAYELDSTFLARSLWKSVIWHELRLSKSMAICEALVVTKRMLATAGDCAQGAEGRSPE